MKNWIKTISSAAAPAVMLICAGWYVYDSFIRQMPTDALSDFRWYYLAADHVLDGESPYLSEGYIYPPFLAFVLTPLAYLEYVPARWVWFLVSHACLLAAAWLIWRELGYNRLAGCVVAAVWAFGGAARESLALGQVGPNWPCCWRQHTRSAGAGQASVSEPASLSKSSPACSA
jgi:hypothetical protein